MGKTTAIMIVSLLMSIGSFLFFFDRIRENSVPFYTDEAYWVSTGRIVPMVLNKRFNDPFWHEYFGFTNFNGAKIIYGIGLAIFGHSESELIDVKTAPETYYHWIGDDGKVLPPGHPLFSLVRDARIISTIFVSLSIGATVLLAYILVPKTLIALATGVLLFFHPITQYVAVHAYADGIFLFFILLFLLSSIRLLKNNLHRSHYKDLIVLGGIAGALISIKINGGVFLIAYFVSYLLRIITEKKDVRARLILIPLSVITASALVVFLFINANILFFPDYTVSQMIQDRAEITKQHVAYYSAMDPDHVTLPLISRLQSLMKHAFPLWFIPFFIVGLMITVIKKQIGIKHILLFFSMGIVVLIYCLSYVVFDEIRYFLPILPFIVFIAAQSAGVIKIELQKRT